MMWDVNYLSSQGCTIDRTFCHDDIQHDNRGYADIRNDIHGRAVWILPVVPLSLQTNPQR